VHPFRSTEVCRGRAAVSDFDRKCPYASALIICGAKEIGMRVQNRMLVLRVLAAGPLIASALFAASPAAADDGDTCADSLRSDVAIDACTRAITSRQYAAQNPAALYTSRGIAYLATGQFDRAIQDIDEAMRLDPQFGQGDGTDPVDVGDGRFIFCCRAMLFDSRVRATWAIRENANLESCAATCMRTLSVR
jgi:tetratricopeptide (TPR) repeat protein